MKNVVAIQLKSLGFRIFCHRGFHDHIILKKIPPKQFIITSMEKKETKNLSNFKIEIPLDMISLLKIPGVAFEFGLY